MSWKDREKEYQAQYRKDNKERIALKKKEWRERNIERVRNQQKEYRQNRDYDFTGYVREWKKNNPERVSAMYRRRNLKVKYGLTVKEFDTLIEKQNKVCAVCEQPEKLVRNGNVQPLSVDHNHSTGEIRGLLCNDCNRNLIAQRDDPAIFLKAAAYLSREKVK